MMHRLRAILIIIAVFAVKSKAFADAAPAQYLRRGLAEQQAMQYSTAIKYYRKYLRAYPRDYDTWNLLGACYFHVGSPQKALTYLKKIRERVSQRSMNLYYIGVSYSSLENYRGALQYLSMAARGNDDFAARAVFELAVIEYRQRRADHARYWINQYLSRFPAGMHRNTLVHMSSNLERGEYVDDIEGSAQENLESSLYRYSQLSLVPRPHYWFIEGGYQWEIGSVRNPAAGPDGSPAVKTEPYERHELIANAGIGLGPIESGNSTAFLGYHYLQNWKADNERMATFLDDPTDIQYIPFRPDLMERRHQFFGDFKKTFGNNITMGFLGMHEIKRVGSAYFPGPEQEELKRTLNVSSTTTLVPWIGASYYRNFESIFYLFLRKELNEETPEYSYKTFSFLDDKEDKLLSFGGTQKMAFPTIATTLRFDFFYYDLIFNDFWLDYTRTGGQINGEYRFYKKLSIGGDLAYYQDAYALKTIHSGSCGYTSQANQVSGADLAFCNRVDTGLLYKAGLYWDPTQAERWSAEYLTLTNSNPEQKVYDFTKSRVLVKYTYAFPTFRRIKPFLNRFGDLELNKEIN